MKNIILFALLTPLFGCTQSKSISNQKNKTYSGLILNRLVLTNDTNVTIINCKITNSKKIGISLLHCYHVVIKFDSIAQVQTGIYALECANIVVDSNYMLNMVGTMNHDIQFDSSTGGEIIGNHLENKSGLSAVEDVISLYKSNGKPDKPIMVIGNWIKGGGPSSSGSGIALGDNGGSYLTASGNILVNPGQVGIGVAGGHHITVSNNVVYGVKQTFANLGIYAWNQDTAPCSNIVIKNNLVNFTAAKGYVNNYWDGGNCGKINWDTNKYNSGLNATILPDKL